MIKKLVLKNRSYRRFYQTQRIEMEMLRELVDLARLSASGGNLQPLKFILSNDDEKNNHIFSMLGWAGYLKDWNGPKEGERPSAYIIVLGDTQISKNFGCDHGIACQSILLGAVDRGFGGCIIATIKRKQLREILSIPDHYEILLVVALGKPKEQVVIEGMKNDGDVKYWRDESGVHHVPKRSLEDIILG